VGLAASLLFDVIEFFYLRRGNQPHDLRHGVVVVVVARLISLRILFIIYEKFRQSRIL